ncbi:MAG: DUF6304 family protein [Acidimicrobiales bacterium]
MDLDAPSNRQAVRYGARFVDRFGESESFFESDGRGMVLSFRDLTFSTDGHSNIEWLTLQGDPTAAEGKAVVGSEGELREGTIEVGLAVDAVVGAEIRPAVLRMTIIFTDDEAQYAFSLVLDLDGELHGPAVGGEEFEAALDRLRALLPDGVRLRMCGTCLLSNNGIYRNDPSGRSCYRSSPAQALTARWTGNTKTGWPPRTEEVADFHVCSQWIPSEVRTWLRGTRLDPPS